MCVCVFTEPRQLDFSAVEPAVDDGAPGDAASLPKEHSEEHSAELSAEESQPNNVRQRKAAATK